MSGSVRHDDKDIVYGGVGSGWSMAYATSNGLVVVSSGMPDWYWRKTDHMAHCQQFAEVVRLVVVDQYGSRGIPRLPSDVRWTLYSNFNVIGHAYP